MISFTEYDHLLWLAIATYHYLRQLVKNCFEKFGSYDLFYY